MTRPASLLQPPCPPDAQPRAHTSGPLALEHNRARLPRSFDPAAVGALECRAWVAYYRHDWFAFLRAALIVSHRIFGLSWHQTVRCSWLVLRATRLWAPVPDNDPEQARHVMERFYRIVQRRYADPFDPATAAILEIQWWHVHREHQGASVPSRERPLADALARLYAHIYGVPAPDVWPAAQQRARAMGYSDQWVSEGCRLASPLIYLEQEALVRSYTALLGALQTAESRSSRRDGERQDVERLSINC